ncbi:lipopolysaccharide biosynthesis protein RfbH [Patescibacteria group bacterium]
MSRTWEDSVKKEYKKRFGVKEFVPGETYIPASGKVFGEEEMLAMTDAVLDGWWTEGRFNDEFEKSLAEYLGVKFALTTNSGSSANLLAFSALCSEKLGERRLRLGDEVISVAASFPTTVNPIIQNGCVPVFVDVEVPTYNIDVAGFEEAITDKTKAVFLAHTLGNPFNLKVVREVCDKHNLWLIEDNCDALGSTYDGELTATFGDMATFSFYPAHHITMGEGGAVVTNNALLDKVIRSIRDWGRDCWCRTGQDNNCTKRFRWKLGELPEGYDHKYVYSDTGYNLKITDMQAALGVAQLKRLQGFIAKRKENFEHLFGGLQKHAERLILPEATDNSEPSWFGFPLSLREEAGIERRNLLQFLEHNKVATRLLFAGNITKQPYFLGKPHRKVGELKNTDFVMRNTFWVGCYPGITPEMMDYMIEQFDRFFAAN